MFFVIWLHFNSQVSEQRVNVFTKLLWVDGHSTICRSSLQWVNVKLGHNIYRVLASFASSFFSAINLYRKSGQPAGAGCVLKFQSQTSWSSLYTRPAGQLSSVRRMRPASSHTKNFRQDAVCGSVCFSQRWGQSAALVVGSAAVEVDIDSISEMVEL